MGRKVMIPVSELKRNPISKELYGDDELSDEFLESIGRGLNYPIKIRERDKLIIDGDRRFRAFRKLGIKEIMAEADEYEDDLEMRSTILDCNQQRVKTNEQICREIALRHEIEEKRIQARKKAAKVDAKEESNGQAEPNESEAGTAMEIAARHAGVSRPTAAKAVAIVEAIEAAEKAGKTKKVEKIKDGLRKSIESGYRVVAPKKPPSLAEKRERPEPANDQPWRDKTQLIRERISTWNAHLEDAAQAVVHAVDGLCLYGRMTKAQREIVYSELRKTANLIRACKTKVMCQKCEGQGCNKCNGSGMLTEREAATAGR